MGKEQDNVITVLIVLALGLAGLVTNTRGEPQTTGIIFIVLLLVTYMVYDSAKKK